MKTGKGCGEDDTGKNNLPHQRSPRQERRERSPRPSSRILDDADRRQIANPDEEMTDAAHPEDERGRSKVIEQIRYVRFQDGTELSETKRIKHHERDGVSTQELQLHHTQNPQMQTELVQAVFINQSLLSQLQIAGTQLQTTKVRRPICYPKYASGG